MILIALGLLLGNIVALPTSYMKSPIIMQISDYNEHNGQPRMEGTMSAIVNFLNKIGSAFGSFLLGIMLSLGGYDGSLQVQSKEALNMIRILFSIIPAIFMVIVFVCTVAFRPLDQFSKEKEEKVENGF